MGDTAQEKSAAMFKTKENKLKRNVNNYNSTHYTAVTVVSGLWWMWNEKMACTSNCQMW